MKTPKLVQMSERLHERVENKGYLRLEKGKVIVVTKGKPSQEVTNLIQRILLVLKAIFSRELGFASGLDRQVRNLSDDYDKAIRDFTARWEVTLTDESRTIAESKQLAADYEALIQADELIQEIATRVDKAAADQLPQSRKADLEKMVEKRARMLETPSEYDSSRTKLRKMGELAFFRKSDRKVFKQQTCQFIRKVVDEQIDKQLETLENHQAAMNLDQDSIWMVWGRTVELQSILNDVAEHLDVANISRGFDDVTVRVKESSARLSKETIPAARTATKGVIALRKSALAEIQKKERELVINAKMETFRRDEAFKKLPAGARAYELLIDGLKKNEQNGELLLKLEAREHTKEEIHELIEQIAWEKGGYWLPDGETLKLKDLNIKGDLYILLGAAIDLRDHWEEAHGFTAYRDAVDNLKAIRVVHQKLQARRLHVEKEVRRSQIDERSLENLVATHNTILKVLRQ
jgi:hypothetical protein